MEGGKDEQLNKDNRVTEHTQGLTTNNGAALQALMGACVCGM